MRTAFDRPDVTLCGWFDAKTQLLTNPLPSRLQPVELAPRQNQKWKMDDLTVWSMRAAVY